MKETTAKIPLSLYIHFPWCISKCPYCDFNSYAITPKNLPEEDYIKALLLDLEQSLTITNNRPLISIFIGGGTPSLLSPQAIDKLLNGIYKQTSAAKALEITLETNPGTFTPQKLAAFKAAGINRLSLGIQSFQDNKLKQLNRIHTGDEAQKAIAAAYQAGFTNINLDLMFGLPQQSIQMALTDLTTALTYNPTHLSWYQLTIEPETIFGQHPPALPNEDLLWNMQQTGTEFLISHGLQHYEISAFSKPNYRCCHNLNYWQFGDYIGIGAGAHSKISIIAPETKQLQYLRIQKHPQPQDYLSLKKSFIETSNIAPLAEIPLEFMLNALRLTDGVPVELFEQRTGLDFKSISPQINQAIKENFLENSSKIIKPTTLGQQYLNECLAIFAN